MLNIGDFVCHKITGEVGEVVGYGHDLREGVYSTTLLVKIKGIGLRRSSFIEDIFSAWFLTESLKTPKASLITA